MTPPMQTIVLDSAAFGDDVTVAAEAAERLGTQLSVVLVQASGVRSDRARRRLMDRLHSAEGFVYHLGRDGFAILLPGSTPWEGFTWALAQRRALGGGLRTRVGITCGVAGLNAGESAPDLLERAASGLRHARSAGVPAWLERSLRAAPAEHISA
jgi:GGDEF domain-containing protein